MRRRAFRPRRLDRSHTGRDRASLGIVANACAHPCRHRRPDASGAPFSSRVRPARGVSNRWFFRSRTPCARLAPCPFAPPCAQDAAVYPRAHYIRIHAFSSFSSSFAHPRVSARTSLASDACSFTGRRTCRARKLRRNRDSVSPRSSRSRRTDVRADRPRVTAR